MAVDASYMNLLPSQLLTNREMIKSNQQQQYNHQLNCDYICNTQMDSALPLPPPAMPESLLSLYQSSFCDPNKADSGLTYNLPLQRKRSRDFTTELTSLPPRHKNKISPQPSFLTQEILYHFQHQQSEIDRVLAHHTEKVRMELEEQKVRQSRILASAIQEAMAKKLKEKDEEIQRMGKLNWALQERVKNLCVENQIWRDLAQTNETTANYLRTNLEQVLAHAGEERATVAEDAQSSCGSNDAAEGCEDTAASGGGARLCRSCGVRESVVLLLPCRHLCLCRMCGSTVRNCPICDSGMDASVHVNLS
ncbi:BOI-related E3 ubiquitin-protein ligase 1 [Vigna radiata var. radiata]|uniref:BOI-related E3 ubiquitin-protein ligase 1 n=1 Tax=Vigna radiata var. radiata TaxID=3916 RepID=A0A1S3VG97_VIGRR|nr:BOI-related E3 ubiquitin-protein ligase 1 [Vigna radiata var. radiata]